ncbi:hypothetical protein ICE98_00510 [Lactococcus lactis]|nr:hypothetical protein [Lactococcus lactis]
MSILIGQFAANAGKKGGEFYTPHEVSQILAKIVTADAHRSQEQFRVYDPAMGSGSLLLTVQKELPGESVKLCRILWTRGEHNNL